MTLPSLAAVSSETAVVLFRKPWRGVAVSDA